MRSLPILAASGASGGFFGLVVQLLKEFGSESRVLVPPGPEPLPSFPSLIELGGETTSWIWGLRLPSLLTGLLLGLLLGPLLDLLLLVRYFILRAAGRAARTIPPLYRILE